MQIASKQKVPINRVIHLLKINLHNTTELTRIKMITLNQLLAKKSIISNTPPRNKGRLITSDKIRQPYTEIVGHNLLNAFIDHITARNKSKILYTLSPTMFSNESDAVALSLRGK